MGFDPLDPEDLMKEMDDEPGDPAELLTEGLISEKDFDLKHKSLDDNIIEGDDIDQVDPLNALRADYIEYDPVDLARSIDMP